MSDLAARAATLAGVPLVEAERLAGGSLSEVVRLRVADGRTFVAKSGGTARAEADMLRAIAATGAPAPDVVGVANDLLVMSAVANDGALGGDAWAQLAAALATLHVTTQERYGWPVDHAFGAVAIENTRSDDWPAFWGARRLVCHAPQVEAGLARRLEQLAARLGELLPPRPPAALLHGDLWGGNVLVGDGSLSLIDPACYYGDREVDVAMLTLFDHPPARFFDALDLAPGWQTRQPIYRLWPLLVHLRLFGSGYAGQVDAMLRQLGV